MKILHWNQTSEWFLWRLKHIIGSIIRLTFCNELIQKWCSMLIESGCSMDSFIHLIEYPWRSLTNILNEMKRPNQKLSWTCSVNNPETDFVEAFKIYQCFVIVSVSNWKFKLCVFLSEKKGFTTHTKQRKFCDSTASITLVIQLNEVQGDLFWMARPRYV